MATDIYIYLEYQFTSDKNIPYWGLYSSFLELPRNYYLFALMGEEGRPNMPKPLFQMKGIPSEVSYGFCRNAAYVLVDYETKFPRERIINRQQAQQEVEKGWYIRLKPSHHFSITGEWVAENHKYASWLYASEYKLILDEYKKHRSDGDKFFEAVLPIMQILNEGEDTRTRLVYYLT